jgi:hypothetical protein
MSTSASAADKLKVCLHVIRSAVTEYRGEHIERIVAEISAAEGVEVVSVNRIVDCDATAVTPEVVERDVKLEKLEGRLDAFNKYTRTLDARNVSNALKHLAAMSGVVNASAKANDAFHIVLEDDVLLSSTWAKALAACLRSLPADYDLVSLGIPGSKEGFQHACELYEVLPCCDSYVVSPKAAEKLMRAFKPVRFATNVQLGYLAKAFDLTVYLHNPNVFLDGSKYGAFVSTLTPTNHLVLNRAYVEARKALNEVAPDVALDADLDLKKSIFDNPHAEHPDFKHLQALYEWKTGGAAAAEPVFKAALDAYDAGGALVNSESQFLRDYIKLHAELQSAK